MKLMLKPLPLLMDKKMINEKIKIFCIHYKDTRKKKSAHLRVSIQTILNGLLIIFTVYLN